jgi:hypothetical protein
MSTKGSSGSRRWITRRPIDTRPIVGMYGPTPKWLRRLESVAPWGCYTIAALTIALAAYAFGADWLAGHLR